MIAKKLGMLMGAVSALATGAGAPVQAAVIPGLFNTGVDDFGQVLPVGSLEPHYLMTSGPLSPSKVVERFTAAAGYEWMVPPLGSAWIAPASYPTPMPAGLYVYELKFDLSGLDPTTAAVTGEVAVDDSVAILINGVDIGFSHGAVFPNQSLRPFAVNTGFVAGDNRLEFVVGNADILGINPTGLLVTGLSGQATAVVPLPAPIWLLGAGFLSYVGLGFSRRRT